MSDKEELAELLREHGSPVGMGDDLPADEYDCCVDKILGSDWLKRVRAEAAAEQRSQFREALANAWDEGVLAKSNSSSIFDSDVLSENPYRDFTPMEERTVTLSYADQKSIVDAVVNRAVEGTKQ